jgi:hypothetical protein
MAETKNFGQSANSDRTAPVLWHHCVRCDSFFRKRAAAPDPCPMCKRNPAGLEAGFRPVTLAPANQTANALPATPPNPRGKRAKPPRQLSNAEATLRILVVWVLVMAAVILCARKLWPSRDGNDEKSPVVDTGDAPDEAALRLMRDALPICARQFRNYLQEIAPEAKAQFVADPAANVSRITRFLNTGEGSDIDPGKLKIADRDILRIGDRTGIETVWFTGESAIGGAALREAVFWSENGEWLLDWNHFVRYSDHPLALFLAGDGPAEAEFRLLARERLAAERAQEDTMSLTFYEPLATRPGGHGTSSPAFLVPRLSKEGILLTRAFRAAKKGKRPFGIRLPSADPDDMIRVRVVIRRENGDGETHFKLVALKACHWYSSDESGFESATPQTQPGGNPP